MPEADSFILNIWKKWSHIEFNGITEKNELFAIVDERTVCMFSPQQFVFACTDSPKLNSQYDDSW